jgi:hypothetical protein
MLLEVPQEGWPSFFRFIDKQHVAAAVPVFRAQ